VKSFVAFGDSITWGQDGTNSSVNAVGQHVYVQLVGQTYPEVLSAELQARYRQQQVSVKNAGCPGETLSTPGDFDDMKNCLGIRADDTSALARFTSIVSLHQYEVVLLMEGSNDVNDAPSDSKAIPTAIGYLQQMIDVAKANGMKVILATIPPMVPPGLPTRTVGASFVSGYDDRIRALASSEGVPLADVYTAFGSDAPTLIGFDGLHPNPDGYKRMADTFLASIKSSLETTPSAATRTLRRVR
jgi:lysophospholipase L1-like esterase